MRLGLALSFVLAAACSSPAPSAFGNDQEKPSNLPSGDSFPTDGFISDAGGVTPSNADCAPGAKLVYVVSQENDLYSFTPNTGTFQKIGKLRCPSGEAVPNSMAIDRQGIAWVNYTDGSLFKVSTTDATCEATSFKPNQAGFLKFGMAFATNGPDTTEETLYISGLENTAHDGKGLGKIDLKTMKLKMLGDYSGMLAGEGAELTGTGDGRLFGFFATQPHATLAKIDKGKGATAEDKPLDGVETGEAYAFSFWGGDFWFYTSDGETASKVTQLKASADGELVVAKASVGAFRIVGAGVSTCAPTTPPK